MFLVREDRNDDGNTLHLKYYRSADGEKVKKGDAHDPPQCGGPCPIETTADPDEESADDSGGDAGDGKNEYGIDPDGFGPQPDPCRGRGPLCR